LLLPLLLLLLQLQPMARPQSMAKLSYSITWHNWVYVLVVLMMVLVAVGFWWWVVSDGVLRSRLHEVLGLLLVAATL